VATVRRARATIKHTVLRHWSRLPTRAFSYPIPDTKCM